MENSRNFISQLVSISIDACSICQLSCPACARTRGLTGKVIGGGFLRSADYAGLLKRNPGVREVEFSGFGEPFLNPELGEIFRISAENGVCANVRAGANLNFLDEKTAEALVRFQVRGLTVSIDGATEAVYRRYRAGGSLAAVLSNIKLINRFKARFRSEYPVIKWQFIGFGHNEHEIRAAGRRAKTLGMDFCVKLNRDEAYSPVRDHRCFKKASGLDAADRAEYLRLHRKPYPPGLCSQLWYSPQITWDGGVTGCSTNHWLKFGGNAFTGKLGKSLNSPGLRYARRMLAGLERPRKDIPCSSCVHYLAMKKEGVWIDVEGGLGL